MPRSTLARHRLILLLTAAATLGAVSDAAADSRCERSSAKAGSVILDRTSSAIVFARRGTNKVWACRPKDSRIWRLPVDPDGLVERGDDSKRIGPQIAGRFVGYVDGVVRDVTPQVDTVRVFDSRTGKLGVSVSAHSLAVLGGKLVRSLVLNRDGAIAWIATGAEGPRAEGYSRVEVHRVTSADSARSEVLDSSFESSVATALPIPYGSLALSADASRVYWLREGQPRSAALS